MKICAACRHELPEEAAFCGFCGFSLAAIPRQELKTLSQRMPAILPEPAELDADAERAMARGLATLKKATARHSIVPLDEPAPALDPGPPAPPAWIDADTLSLSSEALAIPAEQPVDHEARVCRRFPLKVEVGYATEHNFYTGFTENLSSGGLFVATHLPSQLGEVLALTFTVPGLAQTVTAVCRVQWVREFRDDAPDMVPGMGLRFVQLDAEARAAIELFLKHRAPIFFD